MYKVRYIKGFVYYKDIFNNINFKIIRIRLSQTKIKTIN